MAPTKAPEDVMQRFAHMRQQNKHCVLLLVWGDDANRLSP